MQESLQIKIIFWVMDTDNHISHLWILDLPFSFSLLLSPCTGFGQGRTCVKKNQWVKALAQGLEICSEDRFHSCSLQPHQDRLNSGHLDSCCSTSQRWNFWWLWGRACVSPLVREGTSESQIRWLTSKHPLWDASHSMGLGEISCESSHVGKIG